MLSGFPIFVFLKKCASHGHFILYTSELYLYRILHYDGTDGVVNDADVRPETQ